VKNAMTAAGDTVPARLRSESQKRQFSGRRGALRKPDHRRLTGRNNTPSGREAPGRTLAPESRQLGEERIGGNRLNRGRMCTRFRSGVGQPETEMLQNPSDDLETVS